MDRLQRLGALAAALCFLGVIAAGAWSHPERPTTFPSVNGLAPRAPVPTYRTTGPALVVCKSDSGARLASEYGVSSRAIPPAAATTATTARRRTTRHRHAAGRHRRAHHRRRLGGTPEYWAKLRALAHCRFSDVQAAVTAAHSGDRIQIMPGAYQEIPSRHQPVGNYHEGPCPNDYAVTEGFTNTAPPPAGARSNDPPVRPDRTMQVNCPNAKNLIEVTGDPRPEPDPQHPSVPQCLTRCNLQIEGMGRTPADVLLQGDRRKSDTLRLDRAWGVYLTNFTAEQGAFNAIDLVEVNGFAVVNVVARWSQNYGVLSFTSVNGLYDHVTAYGNGDSGVYPGSTEKGCDVDPNMYGTCAALAGNVQGGCTRSTIEIRNSDSFGNTLGYSGTAGNSTYVHDTRFHDNATGLSTDSFAAGHPGMPQECAHWENNRIYSNNVNVFSTERQTYCAQTPFLQRRVDIVCPQFETPVGTGIIIGGGNRNLITHNFIYDNWRYGIFQLGVPASLRNDNDPAHQSDTSNGNRYLSNSMGHNPDGALVPNGLDFEWDGQGAGNCWDGNATSGPNHTSTSPLPACPGSPVVLPANPAVLAPNVGCTAWDPYKDPHPVSCDWFTTPPRPS